MQERGLKYRSALLSYFAWIVAPYAGAWIEIISDMLYSLCGNVAPYAGAWIEIDNHFAVSIPV